MFQLFSWVLFSKNILLFCKNERETFGNDYYTTFITLVNTLVIAIQLHQYYLGFCVPKLHSGSYNTVQVDIACCMHLEIKKFVLSDASKLFVWACISGVTSWSYKLTLNTCY